MMVSIQPASGMTEENTMTLAFDTTLETDILPFGTTVTPTALTNFEPSRFDTDGIPSAFSLAPKVEDDLEDDEDEEDLDEDDEDDDLEDDEDEDDDDLVDDDDDLDDEDEDEEEDDFDDDDEEEDDDEDA